MQNINIKTNSVIRGQLIYFKDDPFLSDSSSSFVFEQDGLLICENGLIKESGPYEKLKHLVPKNSTITHYKDAIICPGFVDTHVHYVQSGIIGAFGKQLLDWLNEYTFVAEQKFKNKTYAQNSAEFFCNELLRNGTTTAMIFCAVYPESVDALFESAQKRNMRVIAGKVLMDRNAPQGLLDTAQTSYDDSKALIKKWHNNNRLLYAITPRFAPTSTPEQLTLAGQLWKEHPDVYVHSHISENPKEIEWVKELFPKQKNYLNVYAHHNLTGKRSLYAHGVHLTEEEFCTCHDTETALSHCPTSNLFLGSGLFKINQAKDPKRPVKVGIGTDIGAGTSFSLLATMNECYKVAQLNHYPLDAMKAFYLSTLGGAKALCLDDKIGSLQKGYEADFVVLDPNATPLLKMRHQYSRSIEETMFILMTMGDDRTVKATYVAGELAYDKARTDFWDSTHLKNFD